MATTLDKARTVLVTVSRAAPSFMRPTKSITYNRTWSIKASVLDTRVRTMVTDGVTTPPTPVAQAAYPIIDFAAFWLAKVVKTTRWAA